MALHYLSADVSFEAQARADYVADRIELDQFEAEVAAILRGRVPERMGRVGGLPPAGWSLRDARITVDEGMETKGEWR